MCYQYYNLYCIILLHLLHFNSNLYIGDYRTTKHLKLTIKHANIQDIELITNMSKLKLIKSIRSQNKYHRRIT